MTAEALIAQTHISAAWHALGGGEVRRGRSNAFWRRDADGWSVSLDDTKGAWWDHRDNTGGGILRLIQHIKGGTRQDALKWLADWRGIPLDGAPLSPVDRRRYAIASQQAADLARQADLWWRERREGLERAKADALEHEDYAALGVASREHYRLGELSPEDIIGAYLDARRTDPEGTAALLTDGEEWERIAESLVTMLSERWALEAGTEAEAE